MASRLSRALLRIAAASIALATLPMLAIGASPNKELGAQDYQLMIIGMPDSETGKLGNDG